ncbi:MAG TPA: ergothioneine biosynthesis protein EgtB [Verrucomicrobiae bacterium]|jgi:ergothioneine biosynthesis protein EgtB|nr:ergothioneine biosynthesis protein EgtB [Verrucomicrobiae bacterium]
MSQPVMYSADVVRPPAEHGIGAGEGTLLDRYMRMREMSLHLCSPLSVEDHSLQPMPDASPAKWHLAHTTWFFETFVLSQYMQGFSPYHPAFRNLFNSYYNSVGERPLRNLRHVLSRPSLDEVHAYRIYVDEAMVHLLTEDLPADAIKLIDLGINHEQQHQELIVTDVKNGLWANPLRPAYRANGHNESASREVLPLKWQSFAEGIYAIGYEGTAFAFDNEGPQHNVYLQPFRLASRLVTNGEFLEFMRDGAYSNPLIWLSDAWDAVNGNRWHAPLYWEQRDGEWWSFTMDGLQPLRLNEPVCHVSFYEADAFARWSGARLPSEFEWEVAARGCHVTGNFVESGNLHPTPAAGDEPLAQMFGDVWEWTSTPYVAYPGFKPAEGAVGEYNGKFMCNQMILRGGSCATPQSHIRATYRNFFPPHVRWQFMGLRLANGN